MICENIKLGGYLVKWALKKKDGRYYERECKKHNTITKACLNNLLEFNGPGSVVPNNSNDFKGANLFVAASGTNNRYGVFNSCALGDGTGTTSVDDTTLKHQVGAYTTTKKSGWCGTINDFPNNICKLRIAHTHTITDNFTIKEIGWFNRIYPSGVHSLSSRVQLDEFVSVEDGDVFYTIYELQIQLTLPHAVTLPIIGKAIFNEKLIGANNNPSIPYIDSSGVGQAAGANSEVVVMTPAYAVNAWTGYVWTVNYSVSTNNKTDNLSVKSPWSSTWGVTPNAKDVYAYVQDSFYRDFMVEISPINQTVYSLGINGALMRFGEYDENNNFVPNPYYMDKALKFTLRQRWSTDLITPAA